MNKQVAEELLVLRTRKHLNQTTVASELGMDTATLSRYENNISVMTLETLEKLLSYYGEDIAKFFARVSENMHKEKTE